MELSQALGLCPFADRCPLAGRAKNVNVPSEGSDSPEVIFLGMNPGREENEANRPFVGKAGQILRAVLDEVEFPEDKGRISNVVRCVSFANDSLSSVVDPPQEAIDLCRHHFENEIEKYSGSIKYLMPLGSLALRVIAPEVKDPISKAVGNVYSTTVRGKEYKVVPNFHPSYFNYSTQRTSDFQRFKDIFNIVKVWIQSRESPLKVKVLSPKEFFEYSQFLLQMHEEGKIDEIFIDVETSNPWSGNVRKLDIWDYKLISFSLADKLNRVGYFVGLEHPELHLSEEERNRILKVLKKLVTVIPVGGHNVKFDMGWLMVHAGVEDFVIGDDSIIMGYLIYGKDFGISLRLKNLLRMVLKINDVWEEEIENLIFGYKRVKDRNLLNVPLQKLLEYGAKDAIASLLLTEALQPKIEERGLQDVYHLMKRALRVFTKMEIMGVTIDKGFYDEIVPEYYKYRDIYIAKAVRLPTVQKFIANELKSEHEFNISSSDQMVKLFFHPFYYNLPFDQRFKTRPSNKNPEGGLSFDKRVRKHLLQSVDGEARAAVEYIGTAKDVSSYITKYYEPFLKSSRLEEGNLSYKADFNFTSVATGRIGSGFHTLPKKGEVKRMVVSRWKREGGVILSGDLSQIEVRVFAALAGEEKMKEVYRQGFDIHRFIASVIFKTDPEKINKYQRHYAKSVVFGTLYQQTDFSLAENLKIPVEEAKKLQDWFYEGFPKLREYVEKLKKEVKTFGYVRSPFGRYRFFPDFNSEDRAVIGEVERGAVNHPTQAGASDIALDSLTCLAEEMESLGMKSRVIGSVHDSIVVDAYPSEIKNVMKLLKKNLVERSNNVYDWLDGMPIAADFSCGESWVGSFDYSTEDYTSFQIKGREKDIERTLKLLYINYKVSLHSVQLSEEEDIVEGFSGVYDAGKLIKAKLEIE
jgi:uracil-DNA glycosylase family 4